MPGDDVLIQALEPEQLTLATLRPYPRRKVGRGAVGLLVLLRIYVAIAIPVVGYAFVHALLASR